MTLTSAVILVAGLAVLAALVRAMLILLKDLAETPDSHLLLLTRAGWTAAIIFTFPIGWFLYLTRGKIR